MLATDFYESYLVYAYYTNEDSSGQFNRIVTLRLEKNVWREESLLLNKIPSGSFHHGGRLITQPRGKLYATTGDASKSENAQDFNSLDGKILRINLNGSIPVDNPFPNSYVYSYGHHNPQGITWVPSGIDYYNEKLYVAVLKRFAIFEYDLQTDGFHEMINGLEEFVMYELRSTTFILLAIIEPDEVHHKRMMTSYIEFCFKR